MAEREQLSGRFHRFSVKCGRIKSWKNKKPKFQKDIEEYKNALSCELENVKATNEKLTYISRVQYDIEITAIKNLTDASNKVLLECFSIIPYNMALLKNKAEIIDRHNSHCQNFVGCMNPFMDVYGSSLAFVEEDIAELFMKFLSLCRNLFNLYNQVYSEQFGIPQKYAEQFYEKDGEIEETHKEVIAAIKQHLKEIRVAE